AVRRIEEDGLAHQRPLGGGHLLRRLLGGRRVDLFLGGRRRRRVVSGGDGAGAEQQGQRCETGGGRATIPAEGRTQDGHPLSLTVGRLRWAGSGRHVATGGRDERN